MGNREEVLRKSEEILRRPHGQADQGLQIAKRLGEVAASSITLPKIHSKP